MPQGGIDAGEAAADAAHRELYEETNVRSVEPLAEAEDWLSYDIPTPLAGLAWKGRYVGQRQKWLAFRFTGERPRSMSSGRAAESTSRSSALGAGSGSSAFRS